MNLFNDDLLSSEEIYFNVNNKSSVDKYCEFEVNFLKTLKIHNESECALVDISLPQGLKTNKFIQPRYMYLNIVFNKNFDPNINATISNAIILEQILTIEDFESLRKEYQIGPDITDLKELKRNFTLIYDKCKDDTQELYRTKFSDVELDVKENFEPPIFELNLDTAKVRNLVGKIYFKNSINSNSVSPQGSAKVSDVTTNESYLQSCFVFYSFDYDLHQLLGFDYTHFPDIQIINDEVVQLNNGISFFEIDLNWFNPVYVYSDIVKESYIGNIRTNILKVFNRDKDNEREFITYSFPNLNFIPVRFAELNSIKIIIADSSGSVCEYSEGQVSLTLVIKSKQ